MSATEGRIDRMTQDTAICTLFEGDYHLGLAAFVNSLVRAGYKGTIWAGYRGALPPWIDQLEPVSSSNSDEFKIASGTSLVFLKLETKVHLANYKPEFMLRLLGNEARECAYLWYFDPDIFLQASWDFFQKWQGYGIALCQETVDNIFPADNPLRQQWVELASGIGLNDPRPLHHYYNSGMAGVPAAQAEFLERWKQLIGLAESMGSDLNYLGRGSRELPFNMSDQDPFNASLMYTKCPLSTLGPQGMGFIYGASMMMFHAVGQKPWRGSFLLRALKGMPPSLAMKSFLTLVSSPIRAYSPAQLAAKRIACSLAAFIGRFYRRY